MLSGPCPSLGPGVVATGKSMFGHVFAMLSISSGEQLVSHTRPRKIGSCHHCATDRGGATQAALQPRRYTLAQKAWRAERMALDHKVGRHLERLRSRRFPRHGDGRAVRSSRRRRLGSCRAVGLIDGSRHG